MSEEIAGNGLPRELKGIENGQYNLYKILYMEGGDDFWKYEKIIGKVNIEKIKAVFVLLSNGGNRNTENPISYKILPENLGKKCIFPDNIEKDCSFMDIILSEGYTIIIIEEKIVEIF